MCEIAGVSRRGPYNIEDLESALLIKIPANKINKPH